MSAPLANHKMAPVIFPIAVLLIAMLSLQGGASLAKSLFPTVALAHLALLRCVSDWVP